MSVPVDKRIMGEAAYRDQKTLIEMSADDLSGRVEAVLSACPLVQQLIDEAIALVARFRAQGVHSGTGSLIFCTEIIVLF